MAKLQKRDRVGVTLSTPMRVALEHLAAKHGLPPSTEATMILRQALDRTISSGEVQGKIAEAKAWRTRDTRNYEVQVDHAVEKAFEGYTPTDL
jgi:hypothetical protein